jgi:hypothetical protein
MAGRKKKNSEIMSEFHKKFPAEYDGLKAEDEIVYKRLSDGVTSIGVIKYFHPGETVYATVIDLLLGSFHTAKIDEINRDPSKKLLRSLLEKVESRSFSRRKKKTKKS